MRSDQNKSGCDRLWKRLIMDGDSLEERSSDFNYGGVGSIFSKDNSSDFNYGGVGSILSKDDSSDFNYGGVGSILSKDDSCHRICFIPIYLKCANVKGVH